MRLKKTFTNLVSINEAFDTKFDSIDWNFDGESFVSIATLGSDEFKLYIQVKSLDFEGRQLVWLNVAFSRFIDGKETELLLNMGNQSKQLGAIISALKAKIQDITTQYEINAIVFMAIANEEKRISFYEKLAHSSKLGLHNWRYLATVQWAGFRAVVMSEKNLTKDEFETLKADFEKRGKSLN